jgi:hypothetical protein
MISETTILGIDVSRDWLDGFCLPSQNRFRHPNTADSHTALVAMIQQHFGRAARLARALPPRILSGLLLCPVAGGLGDIRDFRFRPNKHRFRPAQPFRAGLSAGGPAA